VLDTRTTYKTNGKKMNEYSFYGEITADVHHNTELKFTDNLE
jgi:hypothetical protein